MARPAEELLEFDKLKEIVAGFTTCAPGRRSIEALSPRSDVAPLEAEFAMIREAMEYLRGGSELGFGSLADPEGWLPRLTVPASVLASTDLLEASTLMDAATAVRQTFKETGANHPRLAERAAALADLRHLSTAIRRAVMPNGEISDDASPQLGAIRAGWARRGKESSDSLENILRGRGEPAGADYVTLRNDRFVIPVRATDRRAVPGVVHGASATGQTVFVEPLEAIDLNNRLVQLAEDEAVEIARILAELTDRLRADRGPLESMRRIRLRISIRFSRAGDLRVSSIARTPKFTAGNSLRLEAARNPVLEATLAAGSERGADVADAGRRGNGAGDQRAQYRRKNCRAEDRRPAALSAQSGIPVTARAAELPMFDQVLADIGDEQSIAADLSTFSAHMLNLKAMLAVATESSLVLVDEMGTARRRKKARRWRWRCWRNFAHAAL